MRNRETERNHRIFGAHFSSPQPRVAPRRPASQDLRFLPRAKQLKEPCQGLSAITSMPGLAGLPMLRYAVDIHCRSSMIYYIWATVNIWYIAPRHHFLKSVLSLSKPQLNFQKIETARMLLSINLNFGCSSFIYIYIYIHVSYFMLHRFTYNNINVWSINSIMMFCYCWLWHQTCPTGCITASRRFWMSKLARLCTAPCAEFLSPRIIASDGRNPPW